MKSKRNSKTAQKPEFVDNGKVFGTSRGVMPKPSQSFKDKKKDANKKACRNFKY